LPLSGDLHGFASIWQDMVGYAETLPAWQLGDSNYWCRAEGLAVHLMGLSQVGIGALGDAKYKDLIGSMAVAFDRLGWSMAKVWFGGKVVRVLSAYGIGSGSVTARREAACGGSGFVA
jgi:hypothetical protein